MNSSLPKSKKLVPISEAAKVLGVSIDTIRRWDKKGALHSQRIDGKNRYFSIDELESKKIGQPLPISEASKYLGISATTLRRLEARGLIKPERNGAGERVYNKEALEKFLQGEYFLRQKKIEEKILQPLTEPRVTVESAEVKEPPTNKVLSLMAQQTSQEVNQLLFMKKFFFGILLVGGSSLILIISIITILFLTLPEEMAHFFGFAYRNNISYAPQSNAKTVLGVSTQARPENSVSNKVLGVALRPLAGISLGIVKYLSPEIYQKIVPVSTTNGVSQFFGFDDSGNIVPKAKIVLPDLSALNIGTANNSQPLQTVLQKNLTEKVINQIATTSSTVHPTTSGITDIKSDSASLTVSTADNVSTFNLDTSGITASVAEGSVITDDIKDGAVTNSKLANSSITFAADSGTSASSTLGDTRTFAGGGIVSTSISGSKITITGTEADTLATVTARGATTSTALTLSGNVGVGSSLTVTSAAVLSALGSGIVQSNSSGGLSSGSVNLGSSSFVSGVLGISNGGTGASTSQAAINNISQLSSTGDILYYNGSNSTKLAKGNNGQCLTATSATIQWGSCGTGGAGGSNNSGFFDFGTAVNLLTQTENVGIGTTPSVANAKLEIQGNGNSAGLTLLTHNNANSAFGLVALDNGNVGIGTTAINYNFLTQGSGFFTGFLGVGASANISGNLGVGGSLSVTSGLSLPNSSISNSNLVNSSLTVTAGTGLTGGGLVSLGGTITVSAAQDISTTASPAFTNLNTTGNIGVGGSLVTTGNVGVGKSLQVTSGANFLSSINVTGLTQLGALNAAATTLGTTTAASLTTTGNLGVGSSITGFGALNGLDVTGLTNLASLNATGNVGLGSSASITSNLRLTGQNCAGYANGGKLTTDASGNVFCSADNSSAGGGGNFFKFSNRSLNHCQCHYQQFHHYLK